MFVFHMYAACVCISLTHMFVPRFVYKAFHVHLRLVCIFLRLAFARGNAFLNPASADTIAIMTQERNQLQ